MAKKRSGKQEAPEANYRALFENMLNSAMRVRVCRSKRGRVIDFEILDVNRAWEKTTGQKRGDALRRKTSGIFHDVDKLWYPTVENVLAEKKGRRLEYYNPKVDGWFTISIYSPQPEEVVFIFDDITEFKRMQEKLRKSEESLRSMINAITEYAMLIDSCGFIHMINRSAAKRLGNKPDAIVGTRLYDYLSPERAEKRKSQVARAIKMKKPISIEENLGGQILRLSACPVFDENGNMTRLAVVAFDITELRNAQEKMRESEEKYRTFLENSFDMIQVVAADGKIIYTSPSVKNIMGYDPSMLIGNRFDLIIHPEDQPAVVHALNPAVCKPGRHVTRVCRCRHASGSWRVLAGTATNCLDNPHVQGFLLNIRDITEQREAEEKLRASEERFRTFLENSPDIIQIVNAEGLFTYMSPSVKHVLGYEPEELIGKPSASVVHPDDLPAVAEGFKLAYAHPEKPVYTVCRCRHKDGSWRVLSGTGMNHLNNPLISGFLANIRDITEQRNAEERLRESEGKFRSIIEQSGDGIVLLDEKGIIIEYNPMMERMTGVLRSGALGRKIWDFQYEFLPKEKRSSQAFKALKNFYSELIKTGTAEWINKVIEVMVERPDGVRVDFQTLVSPITINGERLIVSFNRDVSSLRKAEKELAEQNRQLEAKNTALREVMERLEAEKTRIGGQVQSNIERLVLPLLERIRGRGTDNDQKYLELLEANLREITTGFGSGISAKMNKLTQKEVEICDMIKRGLSSKEIGKLLNISHRTAETHRNRIRKKLEITDPAVNLQTYLKSLQNR